MRVGVIAALALLLALSGCVSQSGTGPGTRLLGEWQLSWMIVGLLAVAAMASVVALAYMAASFMNDEQLKAWAKTEAGQLGYSVIILIAVSALAGSMDGWTKVIALSSPSQSWQAYVSTVVCCDPSAGSCATAAAGGGQPCHIALARDYLQILFESARDTGNAHLWAFGIFNLLGNAQLGVSLTGLPDLANASFRPLAFLTVFAEFHNLIFDLAFKTMMFVRAQQFFLEYLSVAIFPIMMALGLVLRALHFSRKLGGLLIALAMSFYVFFPMFYALMDAVLFGFVGDWTNARIGSKIDTAKASLPGTGGNVPPKKEDAFSQPINVMDICGTSTSEQKAGQDSMVDELSSQWSKAMFGNWKHSGADFIDAYFGPSGPVSTLATLMTFSLVAPFMGLMASLAAFKYFSPLLGGDVEISLLSRLI